MQYTKREVQSNLLKWIYYPDFHTPEHVDFSLPSKWPTQGYAWLNKHNIQYGDTQSTSI